MKYDIIKAKIKECFRNVTLKKSLKCIGIVIGGLYILLVLIRIPYVYKEGKTAEQVTKIHADKLDPIDVMGENLPPDPGEKADLTVQGIDANNNGIRDDVELAIFKKYPYSAKARAAMLQYAHALQMETTETMVNEGTAIAVAQERSRASGCIGKTVSRDDLAKFIEKTQEYRSFVKSQQINTTEREKDEETFLSHLRSYSDITGENCDIKLNELPN
jgi:hypothetical protein